MSTIGCHTIGHPLGWAAIGHSQLIDTPPPCKIATGTATLCRGDNNALDLHISPVEVAGELTSWDTNQYTVQMVFRTQEIPSASAQLLMPLLHFSGYQQQTLTKDATASRFVVSTRANALALDLLGAALLSPAGITGLLHDPEQGTLYELVARMGLKDEAVGHVWMSLQGKHLFIESKVEYAVLWRLSIGSNQFSSFILKPRQSTWIACSLCTSEAENVRFLAVPTPSVPQLSHWFR